MERETMKRCRKCGAIKPLEEFYRAKASADGASSYCKECAKKNAHKHYHTLKARADEASLLAIVAALPLQLLEQEIKERKQRLNFAR